MTLRGRQGRRSWKTPSPKGLRKGRTADSASAEEGYDALKRYARDLTQAARGPASSTR